MYSTNDFFCGGGGMGLGFQKAGFKINGAYDFDKFAVQSYAHNVDKNVLLVDVRDMKWYDVKRANSWTFGAPCQAYSVAGKQLGMTFKCSHCGHEEVFEGEDIINRTTSCTMCYWKSNPKDPRGITFFEIMRLLKETKENKPEDLPEIIMLENVKGIRKFLPVIQEEYRKRGYKMYYKLYNSKWFGVPQGRERYFVIGVRDDIEHEFEFREEQLDFVPKLSSVLEKDVPEKYYIEDSKAAIVIEQAKQRVELKGIHACLTPDRTSKRQNGRRAKEDEEEMFTLTSQDRHGVIIIAGRLEHYRNDQMNRVYDTDGISPTATVVSGGGREIKILEKPSYRVRKLTAREYMRLQGFSDTYEFVVSNSQIYKIAGNAVTVGVSTSLARSIRDFLNQIGVVING